ncbi:phosphodiester glycosidase family protein [Tateyamaria sp.]|uniref:phosphodiester glycosidase family protein n=1 Tax=Tateyamaria sp. TaxID=1929288 RepID=UPI00329BFFED
MIRAALFALLAWSAPALAATCENVQYSGKGYAICTVDLTSEDLRLFLYDEDDAVLGQFGAVDRALAESGEELSFAMNAGMYHSDRAPVGHYIENNTEIMRVIPNAGPGNFGLLPNGIFCIRQGRADVIETLKYVDEAPDCTYATQSGPMLVIDGALHPRFLVDSTSRFTRNGVGTSADGKTAFFAISRGQVTFHEFGSLFRDHLETPNALFLDGNISRLYAPDLSRNDIGFSLGPIVGTVVSTN